MGLLGKRVTLLVLPEGTCQVKRYTVCKRTPTVSILILLLIIAGLSVFSYTTYKQYRRVAGKDDEITSLRQKAAMQEVQIYAFADKMRLLEREMAKLRQFDRKLRAMTKDAKLLKPAAAEAVGGSDGSLTDPQTTLKASTEELIRQMHRDIDRLLAETNVQEINQHQIGKFLQDSQSILASTPEAWPLKGPITSFFGYRPSPFGGSKEFHRGLDIQAPNGTPVCSPADGIVVDVEWNAGYGMILSINHGYGLVTRYAHLSQTFVEPGQRVRRGEKICAVGATGRVTGPHLHYEAILDGIPVNPMRFLASK